MPYIDDILNKLTMYRLTLYGLTAIAVLAILLGFAGAISYGGVSLLLSLALLILVCLISNTLFARLFGAAPSVESAYITAYILFLILAPMASAADAGWLAAAAVAAMGSKYLLAIKKKHIFNPAALGAFAVGAAGSGMNIWWVATPMLLPAVLVVGLLIVRKIRRFDLFWSFVIASSAALVLYDAATGVGAWSGLTQYTLSWPFVFVATIMLTEPSTTPPVRTMRLAYGALVGVLCAFPFHIGAVYASPALALLVGNAFSYIMSPKGRFALRFVAAEKLSAHVYEFAFATSAPVRFAPGQYMEWTLPHAKPDTRGNRRYFTIASAPGDTLVRLGVRVSEASSSFKKALRALREGETLSAASLAGEFTLPRDSSHKLLFIAGGVGITPFVSMVRHLLARGERRDIVLIYAASSEEDFAYRSVLAQAQEKLGMRVVYVAKEILTPERIREAAPDYRTRLCYLSGPQAMVRAYRALLAGLGVPRRRIQTDYFPGL